MSANFDNPVVGTLVGDRQLLDLLAEAVTWGKRGVPSGGPTGGFDLSAGPAPVGDRRADLRSLTEANPLLARPVSLAGPDSGIDLVAQRLVEMLRDWTDPAACASRVAAELRAA